MDAAEVAGTGPDGAATLTDVLREAGRSPPAAARPPPPRTTVSRADGEGEGEAGQGTRCMEIACDAKAIRDTCTALAACAAEPPEAFDIVVRLCGRVLREHSGFAGTAEGNGEEGRHASPVDVLVMRPDSGAVPIRGVDEMGVGSIREAMRAGAHGSSGGGPEAAAAFVIRTPDAHLETMDGGDGADEAGGAVDGGNEGTGGKEGRGGAVLTVTGQSESILLTLECAAGSEEDGEAFLDRLRSLCLDPRRALL